MFWGKTWVAQKTPTSNGIHPNRLKSVGENDLSRPLRTCIVALAQLVKNLQMTTSPVRTALQVGSLSRFRVESGWPTWRVVKRHAFFWKEHESRPKESGNLLAQPLTSC